LTTGFQSPEGDSLFFYASGVALAGGVSSSFQSPEGDSLFFYEWKLVNTVTANGDGFQSPEGDSLFFYGSVPMGETFHTFTVDAGVSVPRRGFVVFLRGTQWRSTGPTPTGFSPPKGIRCFSTLGRRGSGHLAGPAGGFQSPEGDSLFFYLAILIAGNGGDAAFQSPEGDSLFFYLLPEQRFESPSPEFQSPEGDSLFFYDGRGPEVYGRGGANQGFSPPKGIRCFSTLQIGWHKLAG